VKKVVVMIGTVGDVPRRWVEGIRMAAGLAVTRRLDLSLCLTGRAVEVVSPAGAPEWGEETRAQHLPILLEYAAAVTVCVAANATTAVPRLAGVGLTDPVALARDCAAADVVMNF